MCCVACRCNTPQLAVTIHVPAVHSVKAVYGHACSVIHLSQEVPKA